MGKEKLVVKGYLVVVPRAGDGHVISKTRSPKTHMNAEAGKWGDFLRFNEFAGKKVGITVEVLSST